MWENNGEKKNINNITIFARNEKVTHPIIEKLFMLCCPDVQKKKDKKYTAKTSN